MKNFRNLVNHFVIISSLLLASCGFVSDKPVENVEVYKSDELQTCKIDVSKLSEIFTADQKEQIRCLQENFVQFTKYVRAKNPGTITENELGMFVKRFFSDQSEAIVKGLSLIFQLNMILLKDEADRISNTKISPLFELLIKVNQEAVIISNIMKEMDEVEKRIEQTGHNPQTTATFWALRKQFGESTKRFATSAVKIIDSSPGLSKKLNMRTFIIDMAKKIGDTQIDEDTIDSFIFFKKLIVGGDKEVITTEELKEIINEVPKIMGMIFDVYYVQKENFSNPADEARFYLLSVKTLASVIMTKQDNFELLNSDEIVKLASKVLKDYDVPSFKSSIEALKAKFIGGEKNSFTLVDLKTVITIVHDFFEKNYHLQLTYDANLERLSKTTPIAKGDLTKKDLVGYDVFTKPERLQQLFDSFDDTAINFRYFRDLEKTKENPNPSGAATYDAAIVRNKKGFIEVNIAKWLSYKLLKAYGHTMPNGAMRISSDEFSVFLLDAKPLLIEFDLWSPNFKTFSQNAVLLADLFQQQSNGDMNIDINEGTAYIQMLLTAVEVSGRVSKEIERVCDPGPNKDAPAFDKGCFNDKLFEVLFRDAGQPNGLGYEVQLPRLYASYKSAGKGSSIEYLKGIEGFARDNDAPGIPINRRDITLIIGSMLNIESTFVRFDVNSDNKLDYDDLMGAVGTYRQSIITLAKLDKDQQKYTNTIFLYMASRMEIPKTGNVLDDIAFAAWDKCVHSGSCRGTILDPVEAKRLQVGKLLYFLVNQ